MVQKKKKKMKETMAEDFTNLVKDIKNIRI